MNHTGQGRFKFTHIFPLHPDSLLTNFGSIGGKLTIFFLVLICTSSKGCTNLMVSTVNVRPTPTNMKSKNIMVPLIPKNVHHVYYTYNNTTVIIHKYILV